MCSPESVGQVQEVLKTNLLLIPWIDRDDVHRLIFFFWFFFRGPWCVCVQPLSERCSLHTHQHRLSVRLPRWVYRCWLWHWWVFLIWHSSFLYHREYLRIIIFRDHHVQGMHIHGINISRKKDKPIKGSFIRAFQRSWRRVLQMFVNVK